MTNALDADLIIQTEMAYSFGEVVIITQKFVLPSRSGVRSELALDGRSENSDSATFLSATIPTK